MEVQITDKKLIELISKFLGSLEELYNPFNPWGEKEYKNQNGETVIIINPKTKVGSLRAIEISEIINFFSLKFRDLKPLISEIIYSKTNFKPEDIEIF